MIETERLLLVPLDVSRLEEFIALTADREVMRYWGPGGPFSRDVAVRNFAAALARIQEHGFGRRWIVAKESGMGLGFVDTKYFGESCDDVSPDEVEIGWMLTRSAWGHGYATEAGAAVATRRSSHSNWRASSLSTIRRTWRRGESWRSSGWGSSAMSSARPVGHIGFTG